MTNEHTKPNILEEAKVLASTLSLPISGVSTAITLLDEGNTVPFIARYRKDQTGGIDDQALRLLEHNLRDLRELEAKRADTLRLIDEQGLLTPELKKEILLAKTKNKLDDIYRPYRPKRRTRASVAREQGLAPIAELLIKAHTSRRDIEALAKKHVNPELGLENTESCIQGALDIIAEDLSDDAELRDTLRTSLKRESLFTSTMKKPKTDDPEFHQKAATYQSYAEFQTPIERLRGHQILAMNRGEKEGYLSLAVNSDTDRMHTRIRHKLPKATEVNDLLNQVTEDSWKRLIEPSLTTELRRELTETAEAEAVEIFAKNLRSMLLAPPLRHKTVLAFDPGYRNGCKLAVTAPDGQVLDTAIIYPVKPQENTERSSRTLDALIDRYKVDVLALGNGTATRETEDFIREYQASRRTDLPLVIVSESGASVYSASPIAAAEFPDLDVSLRGAVNLARRLQDPLAELVKIDPEAIGVGQYQHDIDQKRLTSRLGEVVEDAVNEVGVDLNTASVPLLSYVSGISATLAKNIHAAAPFKKRSDLLKVPRLGPRAYEQCAGFLRIRDGQEMLDNTAVHPESYDTARNLLKLLGIKKWTGKEKVLEASKQRGIEELAKALGTGPKTLEDIATELDKPGRDSRADLEIVERSSEIKEMTDLKVGMVLPGVIRNVAAFGAFVDIGVHQDGLVHISELANHYVSDPSTVVTTGQVVKVKVIDLDLPRKRISLSIKQAK